MRRRPVDRECCARMWAARRRRMLLPRCRAALPPLLAAAPQAAVAGEDGLKKNVDLDFDLLNLFS